MLRLLTASIFIVHGLAASVGAAAADVPPGSARTVYLTVREPNPIDGPRQAGGLLVREIARQALSIAARDECGLATRDEALREQIDRSTDPKSAPFVIVTESPDTELSDVRVTLRHGHESDGEPIWEKTVDIPRLELITQLVQKAEEWSRQDFKETLAGQGYDGNVPAARESSAVPESAGKLLWDWNEIAVFQAIRLLHAEIHEKGESPELLGALAVGYANLGVMTELRWSPAHKVFKARALLYAERLVHKTTASAWALAHRAYVRALIGLHAAAAADARNARAQKAKPPARPLPAWLAVIERTCAGKARPDVADLHEPERSLALLLWLQTADLGGLGSELPHLVEPILQERADCFRVVDTLLAQRALGVSRLVAANGFAIFSASLNHRLRGFSDLPPRIRERLTADKSEQAAIARSAALIADLKAAGKAGQDAREPSLTVLGNLIDDIGFELAWRRLQLEKKLLGVSTDDDLPLLRPVCEKHPFGAFLDTFSDRRDERRTVVEKFRHVNWNELEFTENPLITWLCGTNRKRLERLRKVALSHTDPVYHDLSIRHTWGYLGHSNDERKNEQTARLLRSVSPQMPRMIALLIDIDRKGFEKDRLQLERDFADAPSVLFMLAARYEKLKQYADAERCLRQAIRIQPTYANYRRLAAVLEQEKDTKRWLETLQESLKLPSLGLEEAQVQVEIAEYHLRQNHLKEAFPFAEAAARSYSGWSLLTLARYYELTKDWKKAEQLVRAEVERYPSDSFQWMKWCQRTGHGDAKAAEELAVHHFESLGTPAPVQSLEQIGTYYVLKGEPEKAFAVFKRAYQRTGAAFAGLAAAVLADRVDNTAARDSLLTELVDANKPGADETIQSYAEVAHALERALADSKPLDLKQVDAAIQKSPTGQPTNLYYLVGLFLQKRGDSQKSRTYLMRSATSPYFRNRSQVLAASALRDRKIPIDPPRTEEIAKP